MKHVHLDSSTTNLSYRAALALAASSASGDPEIEEPALVAWRDRKASQTSPPTEGAQINTRWHDYGESHNGCLEIDIDGDYGFIFTDSAAFEGYGVSPYVNLSDGRGREFICLTNALRDPRQPDAAACVALDDYTSKMT